VALLVVAFFALSSCQTVGQKDVTGEGFFSAVDATSVDQVSNKDIKEIQTVRKEGEKQAADAKAEGAKEEKEKIKEEEEEEEEETNLFHSGDHLPGVFVAENLIILIVITIGFEHATHWLKHKLKPYPHYSAMLSHVFTELTILGFISFTITMLMESEILPEGGERMEAFEYAHVAIFFVAMVYTIQAAIIAAMTVPIKKMWRACDEQDQEEFDMDLEFHKAGNHSEKQVKYPLWLVRQYHQLRCTFLKNNADLPSNFKFAMYLENSLNFEAVEMMEISMSSYAFAVTVLLLFILVLAYGHTCCTLKVTLSIGWIIFAVNVAMLYLSQVLIYKLLQSGPCPVERDENGVPNNHRVWWVNKYDYPAEEIGQFAKDQKAKHEAHHGSGHGSEHGSAHGSEHGSAHGSEHGSETEHKVNFGFFEMEFHPKWFKKCLDIMQLFNCYYMAWFMSHAMIQASDTKDWIYFFLIPIPSFFMQAIGGPMMFMNYSILLSVSESRDEEVFEETVAYMEKEDQLVRQVRERLVGLSVQKIFEMGEEQDDSNKGCMDSCSPRKLLNGASEPDGILDYDEFKQALSKLGLKFTFHDFVKLVRVVDPDQSGKIEQFELEEFIGSGSVIAKKAREKLLTLNIREVFHEFDADNSGTLDFKELKKAFASHGAHFSYEDFKDFFARIDDDGSGEISLDELIAWVHEGNPELEPEEPAVLGSAPGATSSQRNPTTNLFETPAANSANVQAI
jgi:Ca2+-binding EF-hand superfamily protein/ribosomal protein L12E/L44/L45/RPP1/RPP2